MSKSIKNQVMYRPLSILHELKNNPRTIKKDDFEKLKKSIKDNPEYFEARPLILTENEDGEQGFTILAGNQRYKAALALSLQEAPTVYLKNLSEDQKREIIIRDNVENGGWDMDILANEWGIEELKDWGVELRFNDDIDFDNIESNEDRKPNKESIKVKCPNCGEEFEV